MKKFSGHSPVNLREHGEYICDGYIHGRLYEIDNYPGLVLSQDPQEKVYGEIFRLIDFNTAIEKLDEYEDFFPNDLESSLYIRQIEEICIEGRTAKKAWVYVFNGEVNEENHIVSGSYINC